MVIEKKLAEFEAVGRRWFTPLSRVAPFRETTPFGGLMLFVAFMAVRVPRIRTTLSQFFDDVFKGLIHVTLSTPGGLGI